MFIFTGCEEKCQKDIKDSQDSVQISKQIYVDELPITYNDTVKTFFPKKNQIAQIHSYNFNDYLITFYNYSFDSSANDYYLSNYFEIKRNGKTLFKKLSSILDEKDMEEFNKNFVNIEKKHLVNYKFKPIEKNTNSFAMNGALYLDTIAYINKNKIPYLVIKSNHNGGNKGGYDFLIFELGNEFHVKLDIFATETEGTMFSFNDIDGDGIPEVIFHIYMLFDEKFIAAMCDGMLQKIILHWKDGEYQIYKEKMKQPPPTESELNQFAKEYTKRLAEYNDKPGIELFNQIISYAYSGNKASAYKLLDMVWKSKYGSKAQFKQYYDQTLKECEWYEDN